MADAPADVGVLLLGGWESPEAEGPWEGMWAYGPEVGWRELRLSSLPDPGDVFGFDTESRRGVFLEVGGGTWVFDPNGPAWEERLPDAPPAHGARAAYDAESDRLIAFGGDNFTGPLFDATWAYDYKANAWTRMEPKLSPSPRSYHAMAYHAGSDRVILFGGHGLADTWAYDYDTDTWAEVTPDSGPGPRQYSAMAYDVESDRVILFGGVTGRVEEPLGDTWAFDATARTWTELPVTGPTPRGWHVLAADSETGTLVLYGGGASRAACTAETWLFDGRSDTWVEVSPDQ